MIELVHATCVALPSRGRGSRGQAWQGVLLRGPSGIGKSDLALRLIERGGRLVADDQTTLTRRGRRIVATSPATIAGLLEVRGVGIVRLGRVQVMAQASIALLVDLVPPKRIERLPEPAREDLLGLDLPVLALTPFESSAPAKLRLALAQIAAA